MTPGLGDRFVPAPGLVWRGTPVPEAPHTVLDVVTYEAPAPYPWLVLAVESWVVDAQLANGMSREEIVRASSPFPFAPGDLRVPLATITSQPV